MQIAIVLCLFVLTVALFITEKIPFHITTLLAIAILIFTRILTPVEAFSGYGSEIIIILGSIFVISASLQRSHILEWLVSAVIRTGRSRLRPLSLLIMAMAGSVSAFLNNTTVAALFLPPVMRIARRSHIPASRLLMPLAFASIMGGTCTLVGTSTNLAVSGYLAGRGLEPLGFFETAPVGLVILGVGMLYMVLIGIRLLPTAENETVTPSDALRAYLCEVTVLPKSPLVGQRATEWDLALIGCRVLKVKRCDEESLASWDVVIESGDQLLVEGEVEGLIKIQRIEGIRVEGSRDLKDLKSKSADMFVAEVVVLPRARIAGKTLTEADFHQFYGLRVIAINHVGEPVVLGQFGDIEIRGGDVLLVQGRKERIDALRGDTELIPVGGHDAKVPASWHAWVTLGAFLLAIIAGASGIFPLSGSLLAAAIIATLTGTQSLTQLNEAIDWRLLILIGGMFAFGIAMENSGAATWLSQSVVAGLAPWGTLVILAGFCLLTILLTQPMSNAAAALVVLPVALSGAREAGADERSFAIAIMLAASVSFITPFEPASLLVYGPGKYRMRDFLVIGGGLTLILLVVVLLMVPLIWPLH